MTTGEVRAWLKRNGYPSSRPSIYQLMRERRFPAPRREGFRSVWNTAEVEAWGAERALRIKLAKISPDSIFEYAQSFSSDWRRTMVKWAASRSRSEHEFAHQFDKALALIPRDFHEDVRMMSTALRLSSELFAGPRGHQMVTRPNWWSKLRARIARIRDGFRRPLSGEDQVEEIAQRVSDAIQLLDEDHEDASPPDR